MVPPIYNGREEALPNWIGCGCAADLRLWVRRRVGLKFVGAPLSGSSTVGMGLFSNCLVHKRETE